MSIARPVAKSVASPIARAVTGASSGSFPGLPSGAIAAWYADEYQATPRRVIPNAITSEPVSKNLFAAARRRFSDTNYWSALNATLTDDAAVGPDDVSGEASTMVASAATWNVRQALGANIPAGTYTLACWVKRNTGTDQTFCFSKDNTSTRSSIQTATSAWQRFTYTFSLASNTAPTQLLLCNDGSTTASLQICDFELFAGSSDLGGVTGTTPAGHLYLGANHYSTLPAVASNQLELTSTGYGQVQLTANQNLSDGFTYIAVTSKTSAGSSHHATLAKMQNFQHLTLSQEVNQAPQYWLGTQEAPNFRGCIESLNQGYFAWGWRYDGANRDVLLNDHVLFRKSGAVTSQTYRDFNFGFVSATSLTPGEKVYAAALWNRALTDEEYISAYDYLVAKATAASVSMGTERVLCFEGDSITGANGNCWPYYYGINLSSPDFLGNNLAVSGSTIAVMTTRAAACDAILPVDKGSRKFVLSVLIGANDLVTLGAAAYLTNLRTYLLARRAAGWTVVLCTPTPATTGGFNTERTAALPTMRGWGTSDGVDYLIDFAADATMGPDAAASDTLLYSDGLHPTTLGQTNLANIAATVLNSI